MLNRSLSFAALTLLTLGSPAATAEEQEVKKAPGPAIEQVSKTGYKIGALSFDSLTREIKVPVVLERADQPLEYVLVNEKGRIHESLLSTKIPASTLNIALKLLNYRSSMELFPLRDAEGIRTETFPEVKEEIKKAARLRLSLTWNRDGKPVTKALNELINHTSTPHHMPDGPFLYTGSYFNEGVFTADQRHQIIAITTRESSLINWPGVDRDDETHWESFFSRLPAKETKMTLTIAPFTAEN